MLRPEATIERFDEHVVGGFSWPAEVQRDAVGVSPVVS